MSENVQIQISHAQQTRERDVHKPSYANDDFDYETLYKPRYGVERPEGFLRTTTLSPV
jgi:hypothetical protein